MTPGLTFELINPRNPLGLYLKTRTLELGITQADLAERLGIGQSAVANTFSHDGTPPSFATPVAGGMIDIMLEEEAAQWEGLWQTGVYFGPRQYPESRARIVRQAAFALSLWGRRPRSAGTQARHSREFLELMTFISPEVYREMIHMLWAPFFGAIIPKEGVLKHRQVVSSQNGYSQELLEARRGQVDQSRGAIVRSLVYAEGRFGPDEGPRVRRLISQLPLKSSVAEVRALMTEAEIVQEDDPDRRHFYDAQVISHALAGRAEHAMRLMGSNLDNWDNALEDDAQEASEALHNADLSTAGTH